MSLFRPGRGGVCSHDNLLLKCRICSPQNYCNHVPPLAVRRGETSWYKGACETCCPEYAAFRERERAKIRAGAAYKIQKARTEIWVEKLG